MRISGVKNTTSIIMAREKRQHQAIVNYRNNVDLPIFKCFRLR
jgi:hypothetical protein